MPSDLGSGKPDYANPRLKSLPTAQTREMLEARANCDDHDAAELLEWLLEELRGNDE